MGDYLDVGGTSPQGEMLRNAASISRESTTIASLVNGTRLID